MPPSCRQKVAHHVNGLLAAADVIDELNLSLSPQIVGGDGPGDVDGAAGCETNTLAR